MRTAVTLLCYGRPGYARAATNLVHSLRHFGYTGDIVLFATAQSRDRIDPDALKECTVKVIDPPRDPALAKLSLPQLIDRPSLYLDVDMIALKDVSPWIETLEKDGREFIAQVQGKGKQGDNIEYFAWASQEKCAEKHKLPKGAIFYGLQSSWMFMRPGGMLELISEQALECYKAWEVKDLKSTWGGGKPDELFWSLACTILKIDPSIALDPISFGKGFLSLPDLTRKHYVFTLYGRRGQVPPRYVEVYDHLMRVIMRKKSRQVEGKASMVLRDKLCNFKSFDHVLR